jgi:hypothetical protein
MPALKIALNATPIIIRSYAAVKVGFDTGGF